MRKRHEALVQEIEELRRRCAAMLQGSSARSTRLEPFDDLTRQLECLNAAAVELAELPAEQDLFRLVATRLGQLAEASFVFVNEYDAERDSMVARAFVGPGEMLTKAIEVLGQDPVGSVYKVADEEARRALLGGRLSTVPGGLHDLSFARVPKPLASAIETVLRIGTIHAIGFVSGGRLLGSASFGLKSGASIHRNIVETFAIQASIAMQRRQATVAKLDSERRLEALTEFLPQTVFECDASGKITYVNRKGLETFGFESADIAQGLIVVDLVSPEDRDRARGAVRDVANGRASRGNAYRFIRKDGTTFPGIVYSAPAVVRGKNVGLRGVVVDTSELEQLANERAKLEEQLTQAQKMEAIGRLAGGIAHDFNNILTGILGYADFLRDAIPPGSHAHADLQEIKQAGERAAALTQQLLAFSRRQIIAPRIIDLNEVVGQSTRMLGRIIGEDIDLEFSPAAGLWPVRFDPAQLEQILANLVTNARDAMPDGGKLQIETSNVTVDEISPGDPQSQGDFVQLLVRDDGVGMDADTRRQIFEPFFSTKPKDKGTGLGLSMVYGIVQQNNGIITVDSTPGVGTTFKLLFHRHEDATDAAEPTPRSVVPMGCETILLVEDEDLVRRLTRRVLERQGYTVVDAGLPEAALASCRDHPGTIDLLMTDVVLPGMNGKQLSEKVRELRPGIKVLFMSGYTNDIVAHHGVLDQGMNFIQKPFTSAALTRKVRDVLNVRN